MLKHISITNNKLNNMLHRIKTTINKNLIIKIKIIKKFIHNLIVDKLNHLL